MSNPRRRWTVPVSTLALVVAVWGSLELSRLVAPAEAEISLPPVAAGEDSGRFPSDAWYLPADDLLGFVEIPGGTFRMGSDLSTDSMAFEIERWSRAASPGTVDLPTFFIGRFEVTVGQFRAFAEAAAYPLTEPRAVMAPLDHPVAWVSWPEALAYARWLDTVLRAWPATPQLLRERLEEGWRVTLPNEAQWEKAARGVDGRIFPWGDGAGAGRGNFGGRAPTPVGSLSCPECPYGLSDMSGNVWEWTRSPYGPYPFEAEGGVVDLHADALWVMRGGSYADPVRNVRAAVRGGADPGARRPFIGFRVAIAPPP